MRGSDLLELVHAREPYPLSEPDPASSELERAVGGRHDFDIEATTLPEVMTHGDLYLCMFRGGAGLGDPLERPYESVMEDIHGGFLLERCAESIYGVVPGDPDGTGARRTELREARGRRAVPVREWMKQERQRVLDHDMIEPMQRMYAESMRLSERWAREFRRFWELPEDFDFPVATPQVELSKAMLAQGARS